MVTYTIETRLDDGRVVDTIDTGCIPAEVPWIVRNLLYEREDAGPGVIVGQIVIREEVRP